MQTLARAAPTTLCIAALAALVAMWSWPLWTTREIDRMFLAPGDNTTLFYPMARYGVGEWQAGRIPLLALNSLGAHPFAAQLQSQALYPIRILNALLHLGREYSYTSFALEIMAQLAIGAIGAFVFFRRIVGSRAIAMMLALLFGWSGYLTGYVIQQVPLLSSAIWLPWLLWALQHVFEPRIRLRYIAAAAASWCLSVLGGMPQISFYVGGLALVFVIAQPDGQAELRVRLLRFAAAIGLGTLWALPLLLPAAELYAQVERINWPFQEVAGGFEVQDLWGIVWPRMTLWSPLYLGGAVWLLLVQTRAAHARQSVIWLLLLVFALLLTLGGNSLVYAVLYQFGPVFGGFRNQERAALMALWSALMLLAFHLRDGQPGSTRTLLIVLAIWAVPLGLARLWTQAQPADLHPRLHVLLSNASWPWLMTLLMAAAIALWRREARAIWLLPLVVMLDLGSVAWQTALNTHWVSSSSPGMTAIRQMTPLSPEALAAIGPAGRIDSRGLLKGDWPMLQNVQDMHGQLPLTLARFLQARAETPGERLWALYGVGCFVRTAAEPELPFAAKTVANLVNAEAMPVLLRCLDQPFPRYRLLHKVQLITMPDAAQLALQDPGFDPLTMVSLEQPVEVQMPAQADRVEVLSVLPQQLQLRVRTDAAGVLVIGETWLPGWRATVNGAPVDVMRAYHTTMAVRVPAGDSRVALSYLPTSFLAGVAAAVIGLIALLIIGYHPRLKHGHTGT